MNPTDYLKDPQKFYEVYSKKEMEEYAKEKQKNANKKRSTWIVEEIRGVCPHYEEGDIVAVIDSDTSERINLEMTSKDICYGFLDNLHFRMAWNRLPREYYDYLTIKNGECRTQCTHAGPPYTPCGGVIFRLLRNDSPEETEDK